MSENIEFSIGEDHYEKARRKGPKYWIIKHLLFEKNKYFALFWILSIIVNSIIGAYIQISFGNFIDLLGGGGNYKPTLYSIIGLSLITPFLHLFSNFLREFLAQKMERDVRREFYTNLLGKNQSFHDEQRIGDLMAKATNDVRQLNYLISPALSMIIVSIVNSIIPLYFIITRFYSVLLVTPIIFLVLFYLSLKRYVRQLGPITKDLQKQFGKLNSYLNERLSGINVIKGLAQEGVTQEQYSILASDYKNFRIKEGRVKAKYFPILLIAITLTGGLAHGIYLYINPSYDMTIGNIISYVSLLTTLEIPTRISIWAFSILKRAVAGSERLLQTMNEKSTMRYCSNEYTDPIKGNIEFQNVSFRYPGAPSNKNILKNISFQIKAGSTLAIVGTTGSGKTTLTKLLSRLYDPSEGQILIDGIPLCEFDLSSLRRQISFIEQDLFLFSKSVKENILFSSVDGDMIEAAKNAQAHDFIMKLPNQYESQIGERGVQLSGGERQRIAIARAFLSDPKILVLDDSTSAIDSETEEKIQTAISHILKNRTTILITHRLSQIRWADHILVLNRGFVVAQGNHNDLLKTCDVYRDIFLTKFDKSLDELLDNFTKKEAMN